MGACVCMDEWFVFQMIDGVDLSSMGSRCNWQEVDGEKWERMPMLSDGK